MKYRELNIKTLLYLVHVISWNKKTSERTDKELNTWAICSNIFTNENEIKKQMLTWWQHWLCKKKEY